MPTIFFAVAPLLDVVLRCTDGVVVLVGLDHQFIFEMNLDG